MSCIYAFHSRQKLALLSGAVFIRSVRSLNLRCLAHWLAVDGKVPCVPENVPQLKAEVSPLDLNLAPFPYFRISKLAGSLNWQLERELEVQRKQSAAAALAARRQTAGEISSVPGTFWGNYVLFDEHGVSRRFSHLECEPVWSYAAEHIRTLKPIVTIDPF